MNNNLKDFIHPDSHQNIPFLEHLFTKIDSHIGNRGRVLLLTLTKKSSEEITNFLVAR